MEPRDIVPETGLENVARASAAGVVDGGEPGGAGIESIGPIETLPPPPPVAPNVPVRLYRGTVAPQKITDVRPVYPSLAQTAHVKDMVILEAVIDARGYVTSVQVLRSVPLLDAAAVDAVRQWRYTPALLNGQPVPVVVTVTVNFSM